MSHGPCKALPWLDEGLSLVANVFFDPWPHLMLMSDGSKTQSAAYVSIGSIA
jgi:hypothetical protein